MYVLSHRSKEISRIISRTDSWVLLKKKIEEMKKKNNGSAIRRYLIKNK